MASDEFKLFIDHFQVFEMKHGSIVLLGHLIGDWLKLARMEQKNFVNEQIYKRTAAVVNAMGIVFALLS